MYILTCITTFDIFFYGSVEISNLIFLTPPAIKFSTYKYYIFFIVADVVYT